MPGILETVVIGPAGRWAADLPSNNAVTRVIEQALGLNPVLEDEVTVEVVGQPGVTKQQLYFCALATANGMVRRFGDLIGGGLVPAYGTLVIEYDAASHWVRCTIGYRWSMGAINADTGLRIGELFDRMAVYRGPQCAVVGGDFDFVEPNLHGIPNSSVSPNAPQLPLKGQPILTACPTTPTPVVAPISQNPAPTLPVEGAGPTIRSPNPKPPGDNRSRGAVLVPTTGPGSVDGGQAVPGPTPSASGAACCDKLRALVPLIYAALTSPASNADTTYPLPTGGPTGG